MAELNRIWKRGGGKDLAGMTFSRWTVLSFVGRTNHGALTWLCRCECGSEVVVSGNSLRMGKSKSCGCLNREVNLKMLTTHGKHKTAEYQAWADMKTRCLNERHACYADYGGRGITVCDRWRESFENFYADMGPRPSKRHSIDRKENDGNYEPGNCRWATKREQSENTRRNHIITIGNESLPIEEWGRRRGFRSQIIHNRLRRGWSEFDAVTTPVDVTRSHPKV